MPSSEYQYLYLYYSLKGENQDQILSPKLQAESIHILFKSVSQFWVTRHKSKYHQQLIHTSLQWIMLPYGSYLLNEAHHLLINCYALTGIEVNTRSEVAPCDLNSWFVYSGLLGFSARWRSGATSDFNILVHPHTHMQETKKRLQGFGNQVPEHPWKMHARLHADISCKSRSLISQGKWLNWEFGLQIVDKWCSSLKQRGSSHHNPPVSYSC